MDTDPTDIKSLAISVTDLVAAIEATADGSETVLRVTPPFSGRMRARLHVVQPDDDDDTIHIDPDSLLATDAPSYPTPDDTADELRADDDEAYSVERHRTYHEQRLAEWRESLPDYVVDSTALIDTEHDVTVSLLGP
ncbi:hypothetical protein Har1130_04250 [Haloarcula sp. CBA1130]|uniref:hypothetical protein n=1 Tax=unclassified Haloarcula TaxID=2624677 RepID=UPI0012441BCA|nr:MULTISPECIES: hypothetical protein [unclassified Haloarcula]KAA9398411.1 hypothetical protein Har1129_09410 [Haloarcula sp. CBA1129]KAA9404021.1 hypothetical protein Har1130_04250 [Haloarcula sp. CBA1130]